MRISSILTHLSVPGLFLALSVITGGCREQDPSEQLRPLVEKYVQVWNTGEFKGLEQFVSDQFELRMTPRFDPIRGLDSLKGAITHWRTAYPDLKITVDEVIYAPDAVTARWTIRATNNGPGLHPPTGKTVVVPGMSIIHVSEGRIIDEWISGNDLYWVQQLGFILTPPSASK